MACEGCYEKRRIIQALLDGTTSVASSMLPPQVSIPARLLDRAVGDRIDSRVDDLGQWLRDYQINPQLKKKKRKVSAYQREFGRQLKALKRKHPRTAATALMKRAHRATKKARRGK